MSELLESLPDALGSMLRLVVVALFVLGFLAQPFMIPSESMERTLLVGDFLLVNKEIYAPQGVWRGLLPSRSIERGDIVVFHSPLDQKEYLVKRVIGLPGDHIRVDQGHASVNGELLREPYVAIEPAIQNPLLEHFPQTVYTDPNIDLNWWQQEQPEVAHGELTVPAGRYFVMGDNRNHSLDSRYWGYVDRRQIVATPLAIYFSLRRPSATDVATANDRLRRNTSPFQELLHVVRWDRILHLVK